jgi:hypothetical protein
MWWRHLRFAVLVTTIWARGLSPQLCLRVWFEFLVEQGCSTRFGVRSDLFLSTAGTSLRRQRRCGTASFQMEIDRHPPGISPPTRRLRPFRQSRLSPEAPIPPRGICCSSCTVGLFTCARLQRPRAEVAVLSTPTGGECRKRGCSRRSLSFT